MSRAGSNNFPANLNGSRRNQIFREDACDSRFFFRVDNSNVEISVFLNACANACRFETLRITNARIFVSITEHIFASLMIQGNT
jgi:hypothetical protein